MMLYNERAELILQQLQLQSTVKVTELSQLLQVSVDTVRRDLKNMEQEGWIKYVRGGACLPEDQNLFSNFTGREIIHSELKREAARKALDHIKGGRRGGPQLWDYKHGAGPRDVRIQSEVYCGHQ